MSCWPNLTPLRSFRPLPREGLVSEGKEVEHTVIGPIRLSVGPGRCLPPPLLPRGGRGAFPGCRTSETTPLCRVRSLLLQL